VTRIGEMRNTCRVLVTIPEGRQRCIWKENFKRDLKRRRWKNVEWIQLAPDMDIWRVLL
jgi:hypothetical protein